MLKLNVGVNRKVQGDEEFSSKGFSCNLEVELADGLLNDRQALRSKIDELFAEAKTAVDDQIDGSTAHNRSQPTKHTEKPYGRPIPGASWEMVPEAGVEPAQPLWATGF